MWVSVLVVSFHTSWIEYLRDADVQWQSIIYITEAYIKGLDLFSVFNFKQTLKAVCLISHSTNSLLNSTEQSIIDNHKKKTCSTKRISSIIDYKMK